MTPLTTRRPNRHFLKALLLSQLTVLCPRDSHAKFARNSRDGHKLAGPGYVSAYIPRTVSVRALSIAFPQPHTFPVHVQSVTAIRPQSVRSVSEECPQSVQQRPHLPHERRMDGSRNRELPNGDSSITANRVGYALDSFSFPVAFQSLRIHRTFLLAFSVAFLALSRRRPNLSRRVLPSGVVVLPLGALAAAPGCVQMLRIFCLPRIRPAVVCWSSRNRLILSAKTAPKSKWSDYGCRSQN
jgi:hypothetical protein